MRVRKLPRRGAERRNLRFLAKLGKSKPNYSAHFFRTRGPTGKNGLPPREAAAPRSIDVGKAYMPFVWSLLGGGSRGGGGGIVPGGCGSIVCVIAGEPARFAVDGRGDAAHESTKELRVAAVAGR